MDQWSETVKTILIPHRSVIQALRVAPSIDRFHLPLCVLVTARTVNIGMLAHVISLQLFNTV